MVAERHGLTPKQLAYAMGRIAGHNQKESLRRAIPKNRLSPHALDVEAHKLEKHPKVRAYIDAALAEERGDMLLTRHVKRQILGGIARDKKAPHTARIQAVQVDNRMSGDDAPIRIEGEITLHAVFSALGLTQALPMGDVDTLELEPSVPAALPIAANPVPAIARRSYVEDESQPNGQNGSNGHQDAPP